MRILFPCPVSHSSKWRNAWGGYSDWFSWTLLLLDQESDVLGMFWLICVPMSPSAVILTHECSWTPRKMPVVVACEDGGFVNTVCVLVLPWIFKWARSWSCIRNSTFLSGSDEQSMSVRGTCVFEKWKLSSKALRSQDVYSSGNFLKFLNFLG
jgi:hypothetical protein